MRMGDLGDTTEILFEYNKYFSIRRVFDKNQERPNK